MYVHTRERDSRPGFDGVKIKLLLLFNNNKIRLLSKIYKLMQQRGPKTNNVGLLYLVCLRSVADGLCVLKYRYTL